MSEIPKKLAEEAEKALENRIKIYQGEEEEGRIMLKEEDIKTEKVVEETNELFSKGATEGGTNIADFQASIKIAGNTASLMRDYKHATVGRIQRAAGILNRMKELSENTSWTAAIAGASEKD